MFGTTQDPRRTTGASRRVAKQSANKEKADNIQIGSLVVKDDDKPTSEKQQLLYNQRVLRRQYRIRWVQRKVLKIMDTSMMETTVKRHPSKLNQNKWYQVHRSLMLGTLKDKNHKDTRVFPIVPLEKD